MKKAGLFLLILLLSISMAACGSAKWNVKKMGGVEAPNGEFTGSTSVSGGTKYTFSGVEYDDAVQFIERVKAAGFIYNPVYNADDKKITYTADNSSGENYEVIYKRGGKTCTVTYLTGNTSGSTSGSATENPIINSIEWDSAKMGGLPAPEGVQLDSIYPSTYGWTVYFSKASGNEINQFIEVSTGNGYTLSVSREDSQDMLYYTAYKDDDGNGSYDHELYISYSKSGESGYITVNN